MIDVVKNITYYLILQEINVKIVNLLVGFKQMSYVCAVI